MTSDSHFEFILTACLSVTDAFSFLKFSVRRPSVVRTVLIFSAATATTNNKQQQQQQQQQQTATSDRRQTTTSDRRQISNSQSSLSCSIRPFRCVRFDYSRLFPLEIQVRTNWWESKFGICCCNNKLLSKKQSKSF